LGACLRSKTPKIDHQPRRECVAIENGEGEIPVPT